MTNGSPCSPSGVWDISAFTRGLSLCPLLELQRSRVSLLVFSYLYLEYRPSSSEQLLLPQVRMVQTCSVGTCVCHSCGVQCICKKDHIWWEDNFQVLVGFAQVLRGFEQILITFGQRYRSQTVKRKGVRWNASYNFSTRCHQNYSLQSHYGLMETNSWDFIINIFIYKFFAHTVP